MAEPQVTNHDTINEACVQRRAGIRALVEGADGILAVTRLDVRWLLDEADELSRLLNQTLGERDEFAAQLDRVNDALFEYAESQESGAEAHDLIRLMWDRCRQLTSLAAERALEIDRLRRHTVIDRQIINGVYDGVGQLLEAILGPAPDDLDEGLVEGVARALRRLQGEIERLSAENATLRYDLGAIAEQAIGLFIECRDRHGQPEDEARAAALREVHEGITEGVAAVVEAGAEAQRAECDRAVAAELRRIADAYDELHRDRVRRIEAGKHALGLTAYAVRDQLRWHADQLDPQEVSPSG